MKLLATVSGKIETYDNACWVQGQKIACPTEGQKLFNLQFLNTDIPAGNWKRHIIFSDVVPDVRNDTIFITILLIVVAIFSAIGIFKIKVFNKTLVQYIKPIWPLVLISIGVVFWQYIYGVAEGSMFELKISQWIWELAVALSAIYLNIRYKDWNFGNIVFLAVLYSFIIHGLKVSIRYLFYSKTLLYSLDRFLYGSLLVLVVGVGLGLAGYLIARDSRKRQSNSGQV